MHQENFAEICGIHAGDGYLRNKKYQIELDVSGSFEEEIYYDTHVIPLFSKFFSVEINGRFFPSRRTYGFTLRNKRAVRTLHETGFPYGEKSSNVRIPRFIINSLNTEAKSAFLRGLFDTDGCIYFEKKTVHTKYSEFKRTHHYYPRIIIVTVSRLFCEDIKELLSSLGIKYGYDIRKNKDVNWLPAHRIWIGGIQVIKWMQQIGSNNQIKSSKYEIWKTFGHCPSHTSFADRLGILNGEIIIDRGPVWQPG